MPTHDDLPNGVPWEQWQEYPGNRWAYQHIDEVVDTTVVSRGDGPVLTLDESATPLDLDIDAELEASATDGLIVLHGSDVVFERYFNGMTPHTRHLLQSVTKSMLSCIIAQFVERGDIELGQTPSHYVPALESSAYGEATIQQTLDMVAAVRYDETYEDPDSDVQRHDRTSGWRDLRSDDPASVAEFLATLPSVGEHGKVFSYCSSNTDVLGLVLEAVTGQRLSDLYSTQLWAPMGAQDDALFTVDRTGFALASGGMCVTLRDLARFGRMVLSGGIGADGRRVVPASWIDDVRRGNQEDIDFLANDPDWGNGNYRNQFWLSGDDHGCFYCAGIYGQYVWMNPTTDIVVARLASQDVATDTASSVRNEGLLDRLSKR